MIADHHHQGDDPHHQDDGRGVEAEVDMTEAGLQNLKQT